MSLAAFQKHMLSVCVQDMATYIMTRFVKMKESINLISVHIPHKEMRLLFVFYMLHCFCFESRCADISFSRYTPHLEIIT